MEGVCGGDAAAVAPAAEELKEARESGYEMEKSRRRVSAALVLSLSRSRCPRFIGEKKKTLFSSLSLFISFSSRRRPSLSRPVFMKSLFFFFFFIVSSFLDFAV